MAEERIKQIFGLALLCENLEETLENWKHMVDFNENSVKTGETELYRYAHFSLGGADMELLEPRDKAGGDVFAKALRERGPGFHHICVYSEELPEFLKKLKADGREPFAVINEEGRSASLYDLSGETGLMLAPYAEMFGPLAK